MPEPSTVFRLLFRIDLPIVEEREIDFIVYKQHMRVYSKPNGQLLLAQAAIYICSLVLGGSDRLPDSGANKGPTFDIHLRIQLQLIYTKIQVKMHVPISLRAKARMYNLTA